MEFSKLLESKELCKHRVTFLYRKTTNWTYQVVPNGVNQVHICESWVKKEGCFIVCR